MKKGDLVRLDPMKCFTKDVGGGRRYPRGNSYHDGRGEFSAQRPITPDEVAAWRDSPSSKGMTSGGDTKLPPTSTQVILYRDQIYTVLRARCAPWAAQHVVVQVLDTETGENCFVSRVFLEVVSSR